MILQALKRYYEILADDPNCEIARLGYSTANVNFALMLSEEGELKGIIPQMQQQQKGKKVFEVPRRMVVPEQIKRSGTSPAPNFLCDGSAYVLGISIRDATDPNYALRRFHAFRDLHLRLLDGVDCTEARAVTTFLRNHDPLLARDNPLIIGQLENLLASGNLVFKLEGSQGFIHDATKIRQVWEASKAEGSNENQGQCLITGEWTKIARIHPNVKGVRDAQSSGATLVGFNARAYESYNRWKGQGWNAPTGEKAAFAYSTVLNYLLSRESENPKFTIGDTTVVYWAESSNKAYVHLFSTLFNPSWIEAEPALPRRNAEESNRLREIARKVRSGAPLDTEHMLEGLHPDTRFYVLGLAPNAARLSVRFFQCDSFIKMVRRIMAHYDDLTIQREFDNQPARIPMYSILEETVSKKSTDKTASPIMAGALMRAILNDTPYPAALYYAVINRIRADVDEPKNRIFKINYTRAAVIKAYLMRKYRNQPSSPVQEVLCMALNEQSTNPAYLLGRLFAVLEKVQVEAIGDMNATIKDRYFTTACASPASVFPVLLRLAQHHISRAEYGKTSDRRIQDILGLIQMDDNPIPRRLSLDEQGIFVLGYYHQRQNFYTPRNSEDTSAILETKQPKGDHHE